MRTEKEITRAMLEEAFYICEIPQPALFKESRYQVAYGVDHMHAIGGFVDVFSIEKKDEDGLNLCVISLHTGPLKMWGEVDLRITTSQYKRLEELLNKLYKTINPFTQI